MLPTTPIASIAPPPPSAEPSGCASEPQSNDAFAQALQRAQGEPARANASRAPSPKSGDAQSRAAHVAQSGHPTRETSQQTAAEAPTDEAQARDATAARTSTDSTSGDARSRDIGEREEPAIDTASATITVDSGPVPQAAMTLHAIKLPRVDDAAEGAPPTDDRTIGRNSARIGAHELRAARSAHGLITMPGEGAGERDLLDAAQPLHAALERAASDTIGTPTIQQRVPAFDRLASEPLLASPLATAPAREIGTAVGATGVEKHIAQAAVHAAIDEPGFGVAVGAQVALWVRDGVQEARLQLHPAELGPVTVQIALQGQAAHVDFTAAVAATRESIEQSLPALAAALRESGFTLAGGGVSSHAGQADHGARRGRSPDGQGAGARSSEAIADAAHGVATPQRWTRSLLDVYA